MARRTSAELKEEYLRWLEPQIRDEQSNNKTRSYWDLVNLMYEMEFVWSIPMDNNRAVDGLDLRTEFAHEIGIRPELMQKHFGPCSFLEVLVGLSRRMAFVAGGDAPGWAWVLLTNLELQSMWDRLSHAKKDKAWAIMNAAIHRQYQPDGTGGFFPLAWPDDDQTRIELWYQLNSYVEELHPERG